MDGELQRPWAREVADVMSALETRGGGLDDGEVRRRHQLIGYNSLPEPQQQPLLGLVLHQFRNPLIYILLIAGVVTLVLGEYIDAGVIVAVVALNAAIGFVQEFRAQRAMEALRRLGRARARVVRDDREREIDSTELVPGDIIVLEAGSKVPADGRLVYAAAVEADESLLTGESATVGKSPGVLPPDTAPADRRNTVYMGTVLTRGKARAVVVATGRRTELGKISEEVGRIGEGPTPLQQQMSRFARLIGAVVLVAGALGLAFGLLAGEPAEELFLSVVALAVSAIPEGLPVVLTIALAISVARMARRSVIVRRISAVETLGGCSAIGSDKTGTLTENRMTVQRVVVGGEEYELSGLGYSREGELLRHGRPVTEPDPALVATLVAGVLASDARISFDDEVEPSGDPTEIGLLVAAAKLDILADPLIEQHPRVGEIPFDPERRFSASLNVDGHARRLSVKGAPEAISRMCATDWTGDASDRDTVMREADRMAADGLRVLAIATRAVAPATAMPLEGDPTDLTFLGLVGMIDPPRTEAIEAVRQCQAAGIRVVMITGDHAATAQEIAVRVGIRHAQLGCLTGAELDRLDEEALRQQLRTISVFARVSPQHKLRIVRCLQALGHTVAVTGDGVNDAPALKAADVGAAMGRSGTDVAREAADIVITDDNFASVAAAVEQGRIAFDNVRKTTFFLVSTGAAEVVAVISSILFRFPLPFLPAQLLWLNLVTNGVQDVALAFEPGDSDVLRRPPRAAREGILSRLLWERTALVGLLMAGGTLGLYLLELAAGTSLEQARSVALTTMVLFQVFHVGNSRSEHVSVFRLSPFSNRFLLLGTAAALTLHVLALYLPPAQLVLRLEPLSLDTWIRMATVALSVVVLVELHKLVRRSGGTTGRPD